MSLPAHQHRGGCRLHLLQQVTELEHLNKKSSHGWQQLILTYDVALSHLYVAMKLHHAMKELCALSCPSEKLQTASAGNALLLGDISLCLPQMSGMLLRTLPEKKLIVCPSM